MRRTPETWVTACVIPFDFYYFCLRCFRCSFFFLIIFRTSAFFFLLRGKRELLVWQCFRWWFVGNFHFQWQLCERIIFGANVFFYVFNPLRYTFWMSFLRPQYFKIIEECVSQIVLHRSGTDPDFTYRKRLDVDFSHLLGKSYPFLQRNAIKGCSWNSSLSLYFRGVHR